VNLVDAPPFESLLDTHRGRLHRYLVVLVGSADAPDCLQDTLLAALRAYPPPDSKNLDSWLFTIAHHKGIDHHRRRARRATPTERIRDRGADAVLPDLDLWDAVTRLPDKQRAAVTLRFAADLAYADVADVLGISQDAARQNVRAALKRLRTELAEESAS
jgi:RNA polymerase sigma factor (sigma-70 family)